MLLALPPDAIEQCAAEMRPPIDPDLLIQAVSRRGGLFEALRRILRLAEAAEQRAERQALRRVALHQAKVVGQAAVLGGGIAVLAVSLTLLELLMEAPGQWTTMYSWNSEEEDSSTTAQLAIAMLLIALVVFLARRLFLVLGRLVVKKLSGRQLKSSSTLVLIGGILASACTLGVAALEGSVRHMRYRRRLLSRILLIRQRKEAWWTLFSA